MMDCLFDRHPTSIDFALSSTGFGEPELIDELLQKRSDGFHMVRGMPHASDIVQKLLYLTLDFSGNFFLHTSFPLDHERCHEPDHYKSENKLRMIQQTNNHRFDAKKDSSASKRTNPIKR